jgi:hypothetical protein
MIDDKKIGIWRTIACWKINRYQNE